MGPALTSALPEIIPATPLPSSTNPPSPSVSFAPSLPIVTFTWRSETAMRVSGVPSGRSVRSKKKFPESAGWLPIVS